VGPVAGDEIIGLRRNGGSDDRIVLGVVCDHPQLREVGDDFRLGQQPVDELANVSRRKCVVT
jgi:hypothetical protein